MKTLFARLNRPVECSQFWAPGLIILLIGSLLISASLRMQGDVEFLKFGIVGLLTALFLLFRTRLGTALYFCLIFGLALERFERGFDFSTTSNWLRFLLSLFVFFALTSVGWKQVAYHFQHHRHRHQS